MKPKEILFETLEGNKSERTPWVPFVGCHGGKLIDVEAETYLKNDDLLVQGISKAIKLYEPDGIPVIFDLQVEAEILGCDLQWNKDNPPTVVGHPLNEGKTLDDLQIPEKDEGRFPTILNAMNRINDEYGDDIGLYGLITGPFTLGLHLMGSSIFMEIFDNPDNVIKLMNFTKEVAKKIKRVKKEKGIFEYKEINIDHASRKLKDSKGYEHYYIFDELDGTGKFPLLDEENNIVSTTIASILNYFGAEGWDVVHLEKKFDSEYDEVGWYQVIFKRKRRDNY